MMKIAEELGKESKCMGLITGESIGQVASQTMHSLYCTNEVCTMPVYRPVIGFDKQHTLGERQGRIQTPGIFGRAISNNNSHEALPYHDCRKP